MKWHDWIYASTLILVLTFACLFVEFRRIEINSWQEIIGSSTIQLEKEVGKLQKDLIYVEFKNQSIQNEIRRVIKQNEAFVEAYNLLKEELNEALIQKRKRNKEHN